MSELTTARRGRPHSALINHHFPNTLFPSSFIKTENATEEYFEELGNPLCLVACSIKKCEINLATASPHFYRLMVIAHNGS